MDSAVLRVAPESLKGLCEVRVFFSSLTTPPPREITRREPKNFASDHTDAPLTQAFPLSKAVEASLTHSRLHILRVLNQMSFECINLRVHHHTQDDECIYHPVHFLCSFEISIRLFQSPIDLLSAPFSFYTQLCE